MAKLIEPRTMSGFRDYPPDLMIPRERVLETARRVYRSYGFAPIDTPAAESLEVLLGKGGGENDRLVYRVMSAKGETAEMGLRFDLTVPFARFSAQHVAKLGTPFKRYAMGPVWRGERPGHGRYREFWQCDFDTIGTTSNAADIETVLVICDLFEGLGFKDEYEIHINNRQVINGLLEAEGLVDKSVQILRSLDKIKKIGISDVNTELMRSDLANLTETQAGVVLALADFNKVYSEQDNEGNRIVLENVSFMHPLNTTIQRGLKTLHELLEATTKAGVPEGRIKINLSIFRGLDYYTGNVYARHSLNPPPRYRLRLLRRAVRQLGVRLHEASPPRRRGFPRC